MKEQAVLVMRGKRLIYEECSASEALHSPHSLVMYTKGIAVKYFIIRKIDGKHVEKKKIMKARN